MTDPDLSMANFRLLSENTRLRDIIEAADIQMGKLKARIAELERERNTHDDECMGCTRCT